MENRPSSLSTLIVLTLIIIFLVGSGALLLASRPETVTITINPPIPTNTPQPTATPLPILVYITGEVHQPEQTIEMPYQSRVMDAISAAGGFTDDADQSRVNLAGILRDGDHIHIPSLSSSEDEITTLLPTPSGNGLINVNQATLEELQTLPGIGPAIAQRIIDYRNSNGVYTQLSDLDNVSGIGSATLETIAEFVIFD